MKVPKKGSSRYKSVVNTGCGGVVDYWGEYDCTHEYDWTCDDCPCGIEMRKSDREIPLDTILFGEKIK